MTRAERWGAALATPRFALANADTQDREGQAPLDLAAFVGLSFAIRFLPELVTAGWIAADGELAVAARYVLALAARDLSTLLVLVLIAAALLTVSLGSRRAPGRDFDLVAIAFFPSVFVQFVVAGLARYLDVPAWVTTPPIVAAYAWTALVLVLAWQRGRERPS